MALTMTSAQFKSEVEPILNKPADGLYKADKKQWQLFAKDAEGIKRRYHEEPMLYGFTTAPNMPEGTPVVYRQGGEQYVMRAIYYVIGMAFALTKVMVEDGEAVNFGQTYSEHLMRSMLERINVDGANILNNAFNSNYPGGDGVSLLNTAHPNADGTTYSNILSPTAALSYTSLQQLLIQIRTANDATGRKIDLTPEKLIVPPALEFEAETILKSVLQSNNANNGINAIKSLDRLQEIATITRLTSNTAWFISTDAPRGIRRFKRNDIEKSMEGDFETDSMRYKQTARYVFSWNAPQCLYGAAGA